MEGVYSRIRYLEKKEKLGKYERSNRKIWEGILMRYGECKKTRMWERNIQKEKITRKVHGKKIIWVVKQKVWPRILGKIREKLEVMEKR